MLCNEFTRTIIGQLLQDVDEMKSNSQNILVGRHLS